MKKTIILMIVITLLFTFLGSIIILLNPRYMVEGTDVFLIENEEDYLTYVNDYQFYDKAELVNDITLTQKHEMIGTKDFPFNNVFDGKGYKIEVSSEACGIPLFNIIGSKGIIKNLEFMVANTEVSSLSFGCLAVYNNGTIKNIIADIENLTIKTDSVTGGLVAYNTGSISYCHIMAGLTKNITTIRKESIISGCIAYNIGELNQIIAIVDFKDFPETNKENILNGEINNSIGAIFGISNSKDNIANCYAVYQDNYISDFKYIKNMSALSLEFNESTLLNTFHFNNKLWRLDIIDEETHQYEVRLEDGVSV